jgi:Tfp pilus assembly protein PilF
MFSHENIPSTPTLAAAMNAHAAGDLEGAVARYREALAEQPERHDILFLLGFTLVQGIDIHEGEILLQQYAAAVPHDAAAYHALAKVRQVFSDDLNAVDFFNQALALSPRNGPVWNDLGTSLHRMGRYSDAVAAFGAAICINPQWALPHYNLATVHVDMNQLERAETGYRTVLRHDSNFLDAYAMLALVLDQLHRPAEAETYANAYAQRAPITVKPAQQARPRARVLLLMAASSCNVRTDFLFDTSRYETVTAYVRADRGSNETAFIERLSPFDLVFSAIADPDRGAPFLEIANHLCETSGRVVLNPPDDRIVRTRRDLLAETLADIPGIIVPATQRLTAAQLNELTTEDAAFEPGRLVRPCGLHGGRHLERIQTAEDLNAYLRHPQYSHYYVSAYHDYASIDGYYRKYRFIFVDREVFPYHLAIGRDWLVHYFRVDMADHAWMRAEEGAFLADYRQTFPGALGETVSAIAQRLDLDFAGLDCAITPGGRLLVFEANAAMLVHLDDAAKAQPHKRKYVPRIFDAIDAMVERRLARS